MRLWNWLAPALFGWRQIGFWQAFGCWRFAGFCSGECMDAGLGVGDFRGRMDERWDRMTPEEREKFRQGMRGRCGFGEAESGTKAPA